MLCCTCANAGARPPSAFFHCATHVHWRESAQGPPNCFSGLNYWHQLLLEARERELETVRIPANDAGEKKQTCGCEETTETLCVSVAWSRRAATLGGPREERAPYTFAEQAPVLDNRITVEIGVTLVFISSEFCIIKSLKS